MPNLKSGWCFNCFKTSHKSRHCNSHKLCWHCNRKYHNLFVQAPRWVTILLQVAKLLVKWNPLSHLPKASSLQKILPVLVSSNQLFCYTLLRLLPVVVQSSSVTVHVLFNSDSQLSYITERPRDNYSLRLNLNTFGTRHYKMQEYSFVKIPPR